MKHLIVEESHSKFIQNLNNYSDPWISYCSEHIHFMNNGPYYIIYTISNNNEYGIVSGGGMFLYGDTTLIYAIANSGYDFVSWDDGNTNATRTITITLDKTYTAIFEIHKVNIMLSNNSNAEDAYVMYNNTKYNTNTAIEMMPNETCTLYTLPKYDTWNSTQSSSRLPFMGFKSNYGTVTNRQTTEDNYVLATYTSSSNNDTISLSFGVVGADTANILIGFPLVLSSTSTPFIDNFAKYIYVDVYDDRNFGHWKGNGYFISCENIILDTTNVISANYLWTHYSTSYNLTLKSDGSDSVLQIKNHGPEVNVKNGMWGTLSPINVSINIPSNSPYEFVKWKIDRMDADYRIASGGSGIYHIYQDDNGVYGNDYFEKYYGIVYNQLSCTIPWPRCNVLITPILRLKTA